MNIQSLQAHKHRGGTLTGFVVGLLVGLGLALSVAVYVTRVPVPFVDRGVSRKPAQDAAEAERNKGWNPNASLAGKPAPLPPPPAPAETPADAEAAKPDATGSSAANTEPAKADPAKPGDAAAAKTAADPLGDLMKAKAGTAADAAAAPAPAAGADPFAYFVQAGAFKSPDEAQAQKARLAMLGMEASISEREQAGRTVFRVRMGPFNQKAMADATREQLEVNGVEAALVRVQR
jgi:cell division protein FtsN